MYQPEKQHTNIKAAIKLYQDGKIDGIEEVIIKDGKIISWEDILKSGTCCIIEGGTSRQ